MSPTRSSTSAGGGAEMSLLGGVGRRETRRCGGAISWELLLPGPVQPARMREPARWGQGVNNGHVSCFDRSSSSLLCRLAPFSSSSFWRKRMFY
uniref:Uncharacterized protein n=1 Tax=Arundo donax TaxID=35708 RepID=A0A0A9GUX3_ARUDO